MPVSEAIGNEATFFMVSIFCGMGLVFVYDMFRILRRLFPHGNLWIGVEDICYWFFCTASVFLLLYQRNDGRVRGFAFLGIILGGAVYVWIFSRLNVKIWVKVLGSILKILRKVFGIMGKPFTKYGKKILLFFRKQLKKLYKAIRMGLCKL